MANSKMSSLFGDDSSLHGSSLFGSEPINRSSNTVTDPWANTSVPTQITSSSSVSTFLNDTDVPEIYKTTFTNALNKAKKGNSDSSTNTVSVSALNDLFTQVMLPLNTRTKIYSLINIPPYDPNLAPEATQEIDRGTWYVAVALIAFSQKGSVDDTLSLSLVDFSRNSLPHLSIPQYQSQPDHDTSIILSPEKDSTSHYNSSNIDITSSGSGLPSVGPDAPNGTLLGTVWKSHVDASNYNPLSSNTISVALVPKREGPIFFRHVTYIVEGILPTSILDKGTSGSGNNNNSNGTSKFKVIRRYSDFDWLLNVLQKKYPFRLLPILPPKSFAGRYNDMNIY